MDGRGGDRLIAAGSYRLSLLQHASPSSVFIVVAEARRGLLVSIQNLPVIALQTFDLNQNWR
jgi:hypothetical protein